MQSAAAENGVKFLDDAATIIKTHDRKIGYLAKRFVGCGVSLADLMQEGRLALFLATKTWRPDGGASLWTYARYAVFAAMMRCANAHVRESQHEVFDDTIANEDETEITMLITECLAELSDVERTIVRAWMEGETFEAIATMLNVSRRQVCRMLDAAVTTLRERAS